MQITLLLLRIAALHVEKAYVIMNIAVSLLVLGACYRIRTARRIYRHAKQSRGGRSI